MASVWAQLIAASLGARVYKAPGKEIGWFPVSLTHAAHQLFLFRSFPQSISVFHWHGDTFDLPENATHLMETITCRNQAFLYKKNVLGLQFHLEVTADTLRNMLDNCRGEITPGQYVQEEEVILKDNGKVLENHKWLSCILERIGN